jgi:glycine cleavage system H protein
MGDSILRYTREHSWVRIENGEATVGLSDFAQKELGEIAYVELPVTGSAVRRGDPVGAVDSQKSTSELYAPLSGTVIRVNDILQSGDACGRINTDPMGEGWLFILRIAAPAELEELLAPDAYGKLLEGS